MRERGAVATKPRSFKHSVILYASGKFVDPFSLRSFPMAAFNKFEQFVTDLSDGDHANCMTADTDTLKIYLTTTVPSASADLIKSDLSESVTGNGYTAGGVRVVAPVGATLRRTRSMPRVSGSLVTRKIEIRTPAPSVATVGARPMRSMSTAPVPKPAIEPSMATFVIQADAVARTRVGKSSARWAPKDGVSMVAPNVARNIDAARNHPESRR